MNTFDKTYNNIISEVIQAGFQYYNDFPKLSELHFKVRFTMHAANHDADRNVSQGNNEWIFKLIDDNISKLIISGKYNSVTKFSLFTKYDDFVQLPILVDFNRKIVVLLTIIRTLSQQRYDRLTANNLFVDSKGETNIVIKC